jgi:ankyrin repeat protein
LYETYERILAGIEGEDSQRIAHNCLLWLAFSQRPLSLGELAEAAILNGEYSELERLPDCRCVTELLGSLVTVSPQWESSPLFSEDEAEELNWRIINLAHSSVVDYLVSEQVQSSRAARFATNAIDANNFIAESCLRYIFYYDQSRFRTTTLRDLSIFPMLQYVCEFWFVHTKMVPVARQEPLSPIINNLFSSNTALLNCSRVYRPDGGSSYYDHHEALTVNPLFYATSIGSQDLLQHLLEAKGDINTRTKDGMTALHVAITCGHEPLVSLLLEAGADVNAENNAGETPLHKAVNRGKQKLIRQLLDAGANPNTINTLERTPLLCSIFSGHESVVQLLLESGADPNKRSDEKVWPLESSVSGRHVTITRLLLNSKADIDTKGFAGNTVLHKAVSIGDEPMVRLLLQYGPNVDEQNEIGQTALHLAALGGDVSNVDLLIKAGAKLDAIDIYGSTALDFAARYSHQAVFELLVAAASSS